MRTTPPDAPGGPASGRGLTFHDVTTADGTTIRSWSNGAEGPTVVLCNGLGTGPWAWPALLDPDCGVHVVSWFHRGVGGSERPRDPRRVGIDDMVTDALAVMDDAGIERAPMLGWSIGVNTMFEMAVQHPARVAGLFAVAGVPGETFGTMLRLLGLPRWANATLSTGVARGLKYAGPALSPVARRLPVGSRTVGALGRTGFMFPVADPDAAALAIREFLTTPLDWYMHMALHTHRHRRVRLSRVRHPAALIAGRWDILAGARDMRSAAERLADATYVELEGTHFLQLEQPDQVHRLLLEFLDRVA